MGKPEVMGVSAGNEFSRNRVVVVAIIIINDLDFLNLFHKAISK